jgi:dihydropteroate synthase
MPPAQPTILGVLNLSPESPNRDSVARGPAEAVERAGRLCAAGAAIVDVGARSSNFAAADCGPEVERRRMVPVVAALKAAGFAVSVDTWEPAVMREAIAAGADMINAADGLQSPEALRAAATAGVPVVVPFVNGPDPRRLRPMEGPDPVAAIARRGRRGRARGARTPCRGRGSGAAPRCPRGAPARPRPEAPARSRPPGPGPRAGPAGADRAR